LEYGLRISMYIIDKAQTFAQQKNRKLLVLLSYDDGEIIRACQGLPRPDPGLIDFLKQRQVRFVDVRASHTQDFKSFNLSAQEYAKRYYIGHYKPQGNHFFAYAIKDAIVDWLEPKPLSYLEGAEGVFHR
jgi:hypothetical protein